MEKIYKQYSRMSDHEIAIAVTGVDESFTKDNLIGVINMTQKKVLYTPMQVGNVDTVQYDTVDQTVRIHFTSSVSAIENNDELFIKVYYDDIQQDLSTLARELTVHDFRTALMGKDGYFAIRPMFGVVRKDTSKICCIYTIDTQEPFTYKSQEFPSTVEELDALERIDYKIPVPGTTYYYPKVVSSGIDLLEPGFDGWRTYCVPTAAPAPGEILIPPQDGQSEAALNYDDMNLLPLGRGSRVKFLKEVKYYNYSVDNTTVNDDVNVIDYTHPEYYTYILSVYVYEEDNDDSEISLNDIDELIGTPATGQPSTLFEAVAAGGSSDAQESTSQAILTAVKDGNVSAISALLNNTYGLAALKDLINDIPKTTPATESNVNTARDAILEKVFDHKTFMKYIGKKVSLKLVDFESSGYTYYGIGDETTKYISGTSYYILRTYAREYRGAVQIIEDYAAVEIESTMGGPEWGVESYVYQYNPSTNTIGSLIGEVSAISSLHMPTDYATTTQAANISNKVGMSTDTSSATTLFGKLKGIADAITNFVTELFTTHPYAKDSSVNDGNDTAISVTKDVQDKVGAKDSSDAAEPSTLFAWFRRLYQNILSVLSSVYDAQNTKSAVSEAASANTKLGDKSDSADDTTTGSVFARLRAIINKIGTPAASHTVAGDAGNAATDAAAVKSALGNSQDAQDADGTTLWARFKTLFNLANDVLAKETNATANKNTVLSAINDTLQVNMLASGVSAMAGVPINVITDDEVTTDYTLRANELYFFNARESDLGITLNLASVASGEIADFHFIVQVDTSASPLTVTIKDSNNNDVVWSYGIAPSFASGITYEIGIINNLALFVMYAV